MLLFDIETNGLLDETTVLHCMAICDTDTGVIDGYGPAQVHQGVERLMNALKQGIPI